MYKETHGAEHSLHRGFLMYCLLIYCLLIYCFLFTISFFMDCVGLTTKLAFEDADAEWLQLDGAIH